METRNAAVKYAKSLNLFGEGENNKTKFIFSVHRKTERLKFLLNLRITNKIIKIRIYILQTMEEEKRKTKFSKINEKTNQQDKKKYLPYDPDIPL